MIQVKIDFKQLREAVLALNATELIVEKIKLVGATKEEILKNFMEDMEKIPDNTDGKFPGPQVSLDFYNSILEAEEKALKEVPSVEGPKEEIKQTNNKKENAVKKDSKQATLIKLLERSGGATIDEMAEATGWQRHSVHGVMSGVLKKRLELSIASEKEERGRVYRISI